MTNARTNSPGGPAIRAVDPWLPGNPSTRRLHQLLSNEERAQLATISSIVRFKKGEQIYSQGERARTIFNIVSGVVKAYTSNATDHITAFLYPQDLVGLLEEGHYANSAVAVTAVTAYALPTPALRRELSKDAELEFHVIAKLCHELRQAQRHALLLAQRHALTKLAMFLELQEHLQTTGENPVAEVYLPMDRKDIAEFVGMSLPAVSRGFRDLTERSIIRIRDRRHVKIVDRGTLEQLASRTSRYPLQQRRAKR
ncbi:MAG: Crp/Fnr family transcriptional regulator [Pseudolabrys sp.]|jgi:CRP/FNR family transcriptional regulator